MFNLTILVAAGITLACGIIQVVTLPFLVNKPREPVDELTGFFVLLFGAIFAFLGIAVLVAGGLS